MGQALYRKHRSRSLDEIIGQEHVTDTLRQAIKQGRISHAYLLTGPRGVGKTSIARILAHEINGIPYDDDSAHMDIIEIDAASNRRIDEIRDLRERVSVAPTSAKYKVYIIDEVHMLTKEAFNALLKTLEEPPAHVIFILATTDAHKLPDTIVSRTQRFNFKPVDKSKVIAHLKDISKQEGIKVSDDALELLAEHGEGSFRDSISLLDQASATGQKLELSDIQQLLGMPPENSINELLDALSNPSSLSEIIKLIDGLYSQGYQAAMIAKQLSKVIRVDLMTGSSKLPSGKSLEILEKLIKVPTSSDPERYLEILMLESIPAADVSNGASVENISPSPQVTSPKPVSKPKPEKREEVVDIKPLTAEVHAPKISGEVDETVWPEVLATLKKRHNTLYGVVRMAQPSFEQPGVLTLTFAFAFHQKRCDEPNNRQKLSDIINELTGKTIQIECMLDSSAKPPKIIVETEKTEPKPDLAAISNIFGEAELLES